MERNTLRKRDIKKQFWINDEEQKMLRRNAKKTGLSESNYLRCLIMGYAPKEQPNENSYEIIRQLKGIGINLNQIARKANALDFIDATFYQSVYKRLDDLEKRIRKEFLDINKRK